MEQMIDLGQFPHAKGAIITVLINPLHLASIGCGVSVRNTCNRACLFRLHSDSACMCLGELLVSAFAASEPIILDRSFAQLSWVLGLRY